MKTDERFVMVSNNVKDNILLNRFNVKEREIMGGLSIVDSNKPKHIEEINGNALRLLRDYPAGNDFCLNVIARAKWKGKVNLFKEYGEDYFSIKVRYSFIIKEFLSKCKDFHVRYNLWKQISKELNTGIILIRGEDKKGKYIIRERPFVIRMTKTYEHGGEGELQLLLHKGVYGSLIDGSCTRNKGDGFFKIPTFLFARCTCLPKGNDVAEFGSYNPIYRSQICAISQNTNCKWSTNSSKVDFMKTVLPEYLNKKGQFKGEGKIKIEDVEKILTKAGEKLSELLPYSFLANKFTLMKGQKDVNISFGGVSPKTWYEATKKLKMVKKS